MADPSQSHKNELESNRSWLSEDLAVDVVLWLTPLLQDCLAGMASRLREIDHQAIAPPFPRATVVEALCSRSGSTTSATTTTVPSGLRSILEEDGPLREAMIQELEKDPPTSLESCSQLADILEAVVRRFTAGSTTKALSQQAETCLSHVLFAKESHNPVTGSCGSFASVKTRCPSLVDVGNLQQEALLWLPQESLRKLPEDVVHQRLSLALAPCSSALWQYKVALHQLLNLTTYLDWETSLRRATADLAETSDRHKFPSLGRVLREARLDPSAAKSALRAFEDGGPLSCAEELGRLVERAKAVISNWKTLPLPLPASNPAGSKKAKAKAKSKVANLDNGKGQKQKLYAACESEQEPRQKQARQD